MGFSGLALALLLLFMPHIVHGSCFTSSGGDYPLCRKHLILSVFGTPTLPHRLPDAIFPGPNPKQNNQTCFVWNITDPSHKDAPVLEARVFLSLNSSGHAPCSYDPPHPHSKGGFYKWPHWPSKRGRTLLLYHNGHETSNATTNFDGVVWYFNRIGFDVAEFDMPLYGWNSIGPNNTDHSWFGPFEAKGIHCFRYFVEPVILMTHYALNTLGYDRVAMLGLSGGAWTTHLAAAMDERIVLSFPIAGGLPFHLWNPFYEGRDWEQMPSRPIYQVANFTDLFVLGALGHERGQLQILHMMDACCWAAGGRQTEIRAYNTAIHNAVPAANFRTVVTNGNLHEVNSRDRAIAAWFVGALDQGAKMQKFEDAFVPFDLL